MTPLEIITKHMQDDDYAPPEHSAEKLIDALGEAGFGIARHGQAVPMSIKHSHNVVFTAAKD